jgi:hypothetical protein
MTPKSKATIEEKILLKKRAEKMRENLSEN